MATASTGTILHHIRQLAGAAPERTDRQLLDNFVARRDEAAFAALVERHGPMVLRVCRRVLGHHQDAEDAFQATFFVLARSATTIRRREALAGWLHGVARRTAMKAKRTEARRRTREERPRPLTPPSPPGLLWEEVRTVLDEEVGRLAEPLRSVFVLCVLEGKSGPQAAAALGCKEATVYTRMNRARRHLQKALAARGIELAALLGALAVADAAAEAAGPTLVRSAVRFGLLAAAGVPAAGVIPTRVAALAAGVTRIMFLTRAKITLILLLAAGLVAAGAMAHPSVGAKETSAPAEQAEPPAPPAKAPSAAVQPVAGPEEAGETVAVSGRVLDPAGKPFAGANVYCQPRHVIVQSDPEPGFDRARAVSDADGRFSFRMARRALQPAPDEEVRFFYNPHPTAVVTAVARGYGPGWATLSNTAPASGVTLQLARDDVPITGRVVDLEGKPVAGAKVRVMNLIPMAKESLQPWLDALRKKKDAGALRNRQGPELYPQVVGLDKAVVTGADGRFALRGVGRERLVTLRFEGPTIETRNVYAMTRPGPSFEVPEPLIPPARSDVFHGAVFDHVAAPTMPVVGTVRDKDTGKPLAGVLIQARMPSAEGGPNADGGAADDHLRTTTDKDGNYRLVGLPRQSGLLVRALPSAEQPYVRYGRRTAVGNGLAPVRLDFALKRGVVLRGRVTDKATGKPVKAEVEYFIFSDNAEDVEGAGVFREGGSISTNTAADGSYKLVGLPRRGIVTAKVWTAKVGRYIQGAGAERIKGLTEYRTFHTYPYSCHARRFHSLVEVNPAKDAASVACNLALDPGRTVTGTVLGAAGRPLEGARIEGLRGFQWYDQLQLPTARFTLTGIDPQKPRTFLFVHPGKQLGAAVVLKGDEPKEFTVRLQPCATITGRVVDAASQPRPGVELAGFLDDGELGPHKDSGGLCGAKTDKDGRFRVRGLIPGLTWRNVFVQEGNQLTGRVLGRVVFRPGEIKDFGDLEILKLDD
jgi:RNA polymerase sigma factor (sigma-70 family)